jgi:hypothetical protein
MNDLSKEELEMLEAIQKESSHAFSILQEIHNKNQNDLPPKPQDFIPKKGTTILKNGDEATYSYDLDLVIENGKKVWKPQFKVFNKVTRRLEIVNISH